MTLMVSVVSVRSLLRYMTRTREHALQEGEIEMADRPNILFFHVDNLGFGELSCYSGGPLRGPGRGGSTRSPGRGSG
jgi:hypothetical protein